MMKKIKIDNLPAGSIILVKRYSLWQRFKALFSKSPLKYNDVWMDIVGKSTFEFVDSIWKKHNITTFVPKKSYSKNEVCQLVDKLVIPTFAGSDDNLVETLLRVNLIRPNTFSGVTLEEMLDNNKYYNKKEIK